MKTLLFPLFLAVSCLLGSSAVPLRAEPATHEADVVIYGDTPAALIAGIQAKRLGVRVAIVAPKPQLGGMVTGGLGQTDKGVEEAIGGLSRTFFEKVGQRYGKDLAWKFEPKVATDVFETWLKEEGLLDGESLFRGQRLDLKDGVTKEGGRIRSIRCESGEVFKGAMFIDASYEGDLMALAGVSYHVGREPADQYHEELAGVLDPAMTKYRQPKVTFAPGVDPYKTPGDPASGLLPGIQSADGYGPYGSGDAKIQAYNFRLCLTTDPEHRLPITEPEGYDASRYELLARQLQQTPAGKIKGLHQKDGGLLKIDPMPNQKTDINDGGPFSLDYIGANWDYPEGDYATREAIWKDHADYTKGLLWFLSSDPRVPENLREEMKQYGYPKDEYPDTGHFSHQLYIRETRRMVGLYVMTEHDCYGHPVKVDSIGMGSYGVDSHHVQRLVNGQGEVVNEGNFLVGKSAYEIPYGAILPKPDECENLLVPGCLSASHIAFGSVRMEPVWMLLGESAATAAVLALESDLTVQRVDYGVLREKLRDGGQRLKLRDLPAKMQPKALTDDAPLGKGENGQALLSFGDTSKGREGYTLANRPVNEFRLYDFYAREADYYRGKDDLPRLLSPFPGLEAGKFGHWGRYSQNDWVDDSWNQMEVGPVVGGVMRIQDKVLVKGIYAHLGEAGEFSAAFDPLTLSVSDAWSGGFIRFGDRRWGIVQGVEMEGTVQFDAALAPGWSVDGKWERKLNPEDFTYRGYFRAGKRAIFNYRVGDAEVLDALWTLPTASGAVLTRTLYATGTSQPYGKFFRLPKGGKTVVRKEDGVDCKEVTAPDGTLWLFALRGPAQWAEGPEDHLAFRLQADEEGTPIRLYAWKGAPEKAGAVRQAIAGDTLEQEPEAIVAPAAPLFPESIALKGELGTGEGAYVVDTIPVPLENPWHSMMFLSGHDFFSDGTAAVCTIMGDVWLVEGIDEDLDVVTWRRYATGLHQALGLAIVDDEVYVLGKDQITRLHDRNEDGEADFYETFCNRYESSAGGHDFNTDLQHDSAGNFYFSSSEGVWKVSPDGTKAEVIATGLRNPNGTGASPDGIVTTAPQEGTWTPTSFVAEVQPGDFYGMRKTPKKDIDPPLVYVPRGVDCSSGGQCFVTSDRWGPLQGQLLGLSFGYCSYYMILRDTAEGERSQGAVVPMPGEFLSGAHRARFNPADGQLYVTGSQGWGNYAQQDGSFQRVRYTGKKAYLPTGFEVHRNGLKIAFSQPLDAASVQDVKSYFCQQWNYLYSKGYGSPEFSARYPDEVGHDPVAVRSAHLLEDGRTVFVEIPDIIPVMQMQLNAALKAADGTAFTADLYPTILRLGEDFTAFPGYQATEEKKPDTLALRFTDDIPKFDASSVNKGVEKGRPIPIQAITGLRFDVTEFRVKAGERISLSLVNQDVIPHNFVVVTPGSLQKVGDTSTKMIADPTAADRDYVPDLPEVLYHIPVMNPSEAGVIHVNAPETPGRYPFLCTYPGHWQIMNGVMIVEAAE